MNNLVSFIALIFILWIGRSIFIPLLFATFLWYLLNAISAYYRKIMPCYKVDLKTCKIPSKMFTFVSNILSVATVGGIIYLFATQIKPMLAELYNATPILQEKLFIFSNFISDKFGVEIDMNLIPNLPQIAGYVGTSLAGIATSTGMVLIYLIFMFVEQSSFNKKIDAMPLSKLKSKKLRYILNSIDENMKKYLFTKTFISAATGLCAYIALKIIGLEYATVWAFIIFILNYIPTIGSILACALPIAYALISGDSWHLALFTAIALIIIEVVFGNIIDPKLTGKTLNISTLAILINLVFWGMIWGPAGMFFSVPILAGVYITTAQFESTRWIATLLSTDGKIPDETTND
ncbi:MAG: AI-2E family transporter [Alphaproteobacteria bacterium]|nr:AI-2E family transporter [Alphaproteobacteria bacterium]